MQSTPWAVVLEEFILRKHIFNLNKHVHSSLEFAGAASAEHKFT